MRPFGICPDCLRISRLNKAGRLFHHGHRRYARNRLYSGVFIVSGFSMVEIRRKCSGSGKLPRE